MSLTSALNTAKSALVATQAQTALVSRNIANVNVEGATRKYANVVTGSGGRVEVRSVTQSANTVLFRNMLDATSTLQQSTAVQGGLDRINEMVGDIANGQTPAALIGKLSDALKAYAASPTSYETARAASSAASDVAKALQEGTGIVDTIRQDADDSLVQAANDMNSLLAKIEDLNKQVVAGTVAGEDITDLSDARDRAVGELSKYVGVTVQTRGNNDLLIYTDSGVTLFDKVPRTVSFSGTHPITDGAAGDAFRIDGVPVTGDTALMPIKSGMVAGLVDLRDKVAVTYQSQLDEMARGLVSAFKESGPAGDQAGLFTSSVASLAKTSTVLSAGTYAPVAASSTVSFSLNYAGAAYAISDTFAPTDNAATAQSKIQAKIDAAVGANKVTVAIDSSTGAITFTAASVASKPALGISNVSTTSAGFIAANAPTDNSVIPGFARTIQVATAVLNDPTRIRDGVTTTYNTGALAGYTTRLNALRASMEAGQSFGVGADALRSGSLTDFASSSVSWLAEQRSKATTATDYKQTLLDQTKATLSNETGVNLDTESLKMLDLERSYQASSKVLTTINEMLKTLMEAI
ncbi:hypothetical protein GCM10011390_43840 [Aureimonas endophytica]|uniref:Flagellar hook-associated protein 1 n=1 Tax=Aureimonas endophytica TaxID=2027858 RepID=A0A916ZZ10_9HYPH|nr:flagellar hook-associated protein FlgK [Aureimonas endophytica]GGE19810.1 hypothetical protein GCM10011390_43840 [Aureimonas endophytica]